MSGLRPIRADLSGCQPIPHHTAGKPSPQRRKALPHLRQGPRMGSREYMVTADLRTPEGHVYTAAPIVPNNRSRNVGRPLTRYQARKLLRRVHLTIPEAIVLVGQGVRP